jgi:hypothetical protein
MFQLSTWGLFCLSVFMVVAGCGVIPGYRERFEAARAAQQARLDEGDSMRATMRSVAGTVLRQDQMPMWPAG